MARRVAIWFACVLMAVYALVFLSRLLVPWFWYERLNRAVYRGNIEAARFYLLLGSDVDGKDYRPLTGVEPNVPLMTAVMEGRHDIAALLLRRGANPNFLYGEGVSPLVYAASRGDVEMIKLLLSHGARKDLKTFDGTALEAAMTGKHDAAVQLLKQDTP